MSKDTECPYCGAGIYINHDDGYGYEEDEKHEQECSECGNVFVFTTYTIRSYETFKAECLNGAKHEYKASSTYPKEFTTMDCIHCSHHRNPTQEEMKIILKS